MSESSTLFLATTDKNVFQITSVVKEVLSDLINKEIKGITVDKDNASLNDIFNRKDNRLPEFKLEPSGAVYCTFIYQTEGRKLQICFDCDCDGSHVHKGNKIIFSLGYWGQAKLYLTLLRNRFVKLGYVTYYSANTSDNEEDWEKK